MTEYPEWMGDDGRRQLQAAQEHMAKDPEAVARLRNFARMGKPKGTPSYFAKLRELEVFTLEDAQDERAAQQRMKRRNGKVTAPATPAPDVQEQARKLWERLTPDPEAQRIASKADLAARTAQAREHKRHEAEALSDYAAAFKKLAEASDGTLDVEDPLLPAAFRAAFARADVLRHDDYIGFYKKLASSSAFTEKGTPRYYELLWQDGLYTYRDFQNQTASGIPDVSDPAPPAPRDSGRIDERAFMTAQVQRDGSDMSLTLDFDERSYRQAVVNEVLGSLGDRRGQDPSFIAAELRSAFTAYEMVIAEDTLRRLADALAEHEVVDVNLVRDE